MGKRIDYDCDSCMQEGFEEDEIRGLESGKFYSPADSKSHICQKCLNKLAMMGWTREYAEAPTLK